MRTALRALLVDEVTSKPRDGPIALQLVGIAVEKTVNNYTPQTKNLRNLYRNSKLHDG